MGANTPGELLLLRLSELTAEQKRLEEAIDKDLAHLSELVAQPHLIVKKTISELAADKSFRNDLLVVGLNVAGQLTSAALARKGGKAAVFANILDRLIRKDKAEEDKEEQPDIISLIAKLFRRKDKEG